MFIESMIERRKKLFTFVQDTLGAIDATHIRAHISSDEALSSNRKASLTQNVMAVFYFNIQSCFVQS